MPATAHHIPQECTPGDVTLLNQAIIAYNASQVPFTQQVPFINIDFVIKDALDKVIGGILSYLYCWGCLYIDILWIDEAFRHQGYGTLLLQAVERTAQEQGCSLIHLDTFDFQAKDFYCQQGYEVFGTLEGCPPGHMRYYLKKDLPRVTDNISTNLAPPDTR